VRAFVCTLVWLTATVAAIAEDTIHFVALAGVKPGKEAQYDAFIEGVTPIWKRHGMTVVARARPVGPFSYREGPVDLAVLRVKSRAGFYAYSRDPDYRALQPQRADAVNLLAIFDGKARMAVTGLSDSPALRVWFVSQPGAAWAKMLAGDLKSDDGSSFMISLGIVGEVKGKLDEGLAQTRTIHIEALSGDKSPGQPPYLAGLHVVTGPRLR